ncbi:MAG: hypothetical protein NZT61_04550 [Deltaproteobacteria bacterium]|nr:hypothetical protein [Deltaproteobacteria bacterium]
MPTAFDLDDEDEISSLINFLVAPLDPPSHCRRDGVLCCTPKNAQECKQCKKSACHRCCLHFTEPVPIPPSGTVYRPHDPKANKKCMLDCCNGKIKTVKYIDNNNNPCWKYKCQ